MPSETVSRGHPSPALEAESMLLYAVAAVSVQRIGDSHWFQRHDEVIATVISWTEDVQDILHRLPEGWSIVDGARCCGLHDDVDILTVDPRFNHGTDDTMCAIIGSADGRRYVLLMLINAAEAVLFPERPYRTHDAFERCVWPGGDRQESAR